MSKNQTWSIPNVFVRGTLTWLPETRLWTKVKMFYIWEVNRKEIRKTVDAVRSKDALKNL